MIVKIRGADAHGIFVNRMRCLTMLWAPVLRDQHPRAHARQQRQSTDADA